nr:hypothetical protein [Tanacetum cinerariifolium]
AAQHRDVVEDEVGAFGHQCRQGLVDAVHADDLDRRQALGFQLDVELLDQLLGGG